MFRAVLALNALAVVLGDLPVHCVRHQVVGDWEFNLGPSGPKRSSCGHMKPDSPDSQPSLNALGGDSVTKKFTLSEPNTVSSDDGNSGTWTMIYDEGFEVAVGDTTYFAFSKFEYIQDPVKGKTNISHCDQTEVGWYRDTGRDAWGCYVARKAGTSGESQESTPAVTDQASPSTTAPVEDQAPVDQASPSTTAPVDEQAAVSTAAPTPSLDQPIQSAQASLISDAAEYQAWVPPASDGYDKPMSSEWQQQIAAALNFMQLGWEAKSYHHTQMFKGKTPRELNKAAGLRRTKPNSRVLPLPEEPSAFLALKSKIHRVSAADADKMDWREKDGKNWLTPVVTQGDCGSCYTISTIHMLTARNRIRAQSTDAPSFSMSFPLYCSEYNQGCDGGYGFLQTKWSEDVGLVPESCLPFSEGGGSCKMAASCDLGSKRYRATNHHYVGGFYGGSDEGLVRQELVEHGPTVVSFEPKEDFMYYKGGVYKSSPNTNKIHSEWEQVDHAVLLVGYGTDSMRPYWTCQNSWGDDWGEEGYFRMARGEDESGIEGIVVAADVVEESDNQVLDDFISSM